MGITAPRLQELKLIDQVIAEPSGGAHRNPEMAFQRIKESLRANLESLKSHDIEALLKRRYQRLMSYGQFKS